MPKIIHPEAYRRTYRLYIEIKHEYILPPNVKKGDLFWTPIGDDSPSLEHAKLWLKTDLHIWKSYPNPRYKIVETIHYSPTKEDIEIGSRERGLSEL